MKPPRFSLTQLLVAAFFAIGWLMLAPRALAQSQMTQPPQIPDPTIPDQTFDITKFGAKGDGVFMNTGAIQHTIDAASKAGGGIVEIPAGKFLTAAFHLASSINLHLDDGATILITNKPANFHLIDNGYENCITADQCHDLEISGTGTIDGQGDYWWRHFVPPPAFHQRGSAATATPPTAEKLAHRPYMIVFFECKTVLVKGVTLTNSPSFHFVPRGCTDVKIDGITIKAPPSPTKTTPENEPMSHNTDGIDLSGKNFLITNCTVDTGDDNIVLKPTAIPPGQQFACENIFIQGCKFLHGHGLSIGGGTPGGVRNLFVRNCSFDGTTAGIRLKAPRGNGGDVENLTYTNISMKNVHDPILITSFYPEIPEHPETVATQPDAKRVPIWKNILIQDLTATDCYSAGGILGLGESPISNIVLKNVDISATKGMKIVHGEQIIFSDSTLTVQNGPPLTVFASTVLGINIQTGQPLN